MRYMCAERNKLRRVFSTAIDLVKAPAPLLQTHEKSIIFQIKGALSLHLGCGMVFGGGHLGCVGRLVSDRWW